MNPGDLVYFYSTFLPFEQDYRSRNPGVVLEKRPRESASVLWANGDITNEHLSYLKVSKEGSKIE